MTVQRPVVAPALSWRLILRVLALVCFLVLVVIELGDGSVKHAGALLPLGLAFWCASTL